MNNLFSTLETQKAAITKKAKLYCDGGSRGNPGIAGAGAVLYDENNNIITKKSIPCGLQTNNFAEYTSLVEGLKLAKDHEITDLTVYMDSKLAIEQMKGLWKVKNHNIKPLFEKAKNLEPSFQRLQFFHIPREKNKVADQLANKAMDDSQI